MTRPPTYQDPTYQGPHLSRFPYQGPTYQDPTPPPPRLLQWLTFSGLLLSPFVSTLFQTLPASFWLLEHPVLKRVPPLHGSCFSCTYSPSLPACPWPSPAEPSALLSPSPFPPSASPTPSVAPLHGANGHTHLVRNIHIPTHTQSHAHIQIYTHIHTHTHTHTCFSLVYSKTFKSVNFSCSFTASF